MQFPQDETKPSRLIVMGETYDPYYGKVTHIIRATEDGLYFSGRWESVFSVIAEHKYIVDMLRRLLGDDIHLTQCRTGRLTNSVFHVDVVPLGDDAEISQIKSGVRRVYERILGEIPAMPPRWRPYAQFSGWVIDFRIHPGDHNERK
jgi:hypothetical protein